MVIKIPSSGIVSEVHIKPKQAVAKGDLMIKME
jgi:biotin carboxyl carrier protein